MELVLLCFPVTENNCALSQVVVSN